MLKVYSGTDRALIDTQIDSVLNQQNLQASKCDDPTKARHRCSSHSLLDPRTATILETSLKELNWSRRQILVMAKSPNLLFVICPSWDERSKTAKLLAGYVTKLELPSQWKKQDLKNAVTFYGNKHGLHLTPDVTQYLFEALNNNFAVLDNRLSTLALLTNSPSLELVKELIPNEYATAIELKDLILNKDMNAIAICSDRLENVTSKLSIIASLSTQFTSLMQVAIGIERGLSDRDLAKFSKLSNVKRLYYLRQELKKISVEQLVWLNRETEKCRSSLIYGKCNFKAKLLYLASW